MVELVNQSQVDSGVRLHLVRVRTVDGGPASTRALIEAAPSHNLLVDCAGPAIIGSGLEVELRDSPRTGDVPPVGERVAALLEQCGLECALMLDEQAPVAA